MAPIDPWKLRNLTVHFFSALSTQSYNRTHLLYLSACHCLFALTSSWSKSSLSFSALFFGWTCSAKLYQKNCCFGPVWKFSFPILMIHSFYHSCETYRPCRQTYGKSKYWIDFYFVSERKIFSLAMFDRH
jgi:hypothetical protein